MKQIAVAIDGPSGAGKSTIARAVAAELGFIYVDTGALYRTIGLAACRADVAGDDAQAVSALLPGLQLELRYMGGAQHVLLNGEDVSDAIRTSEIARYASLVSAIPAVRGYLLDLQRDMARHHSVIMDGRDIGTVVLPDAEVKIFLTASAETRAERRWRELRGKGQDVALDEVLEQLNTRDAKDEGRETAPLRQADDAILLDTSGLDLPQSVAAVRGLIDARLAGNNP
ncbi:MAG: (d)CMP kinase [Intestinibacillus sp.]